MDLNDELTEYEETYTLTETTETINIGAPETTSETADPSAHEGALYELADVWDRPTVFDRYSAFAFDDEEDLDIKIESSFAWEDGEIEVGGLGTIWKGTIGTVSGPNLKDDLHQYPASDDKWYAFYIKGDHDTLDLSAGDIILIDENEQVYKCVLQAGSTDGSTITEYGTSDGEALESVTISVGGGVTEQNAPYAFWLHKLGSLVIAGIAAAVALYTGASLEAVALAAVVTGGISAVIMYVVLPGALGKDIGLEPYLDESETYLAWIAMIGLTVPIAVYAEAITVKLMG